MKLQDLFLGTGMAFAAASSTHAADAVVAAEPEPMEYVRICDAFGTGYFYIPGTETCLKIGGRVRFNTQAADSYTANSAHGWNTQSRAELYLDSASDTEYGPLKTQFLGRWDFDGTYNDGNHTTVKLMAANISLAGFMAGVADSQYSSFTGYAGDFENDDVINYGLKEINQITYTFDDGSGFTAMVSLQDDRESHKSVAVDADGNPIPKTLASGYQPYRNGSDYIPDFLAGAGYNAGAFNVRVVGGYDESAEQGAVKARVDGTFGKVTAWVMAAWSSSEYRNAFAPGDTYAAWGHWAAWGGLGVQLQENLATNFQIAGSEKDTIAAAFNFKYYPVENLLVQPEFTYTRWDSIDKDQWNGMLMFQRTF